MLPTKTTPPTSRKPFRGWYWLLLVPVTAALIFLSQPSLPDIRTVPTKAGTIKVETVAKGLDRPWGLAFLPDGEMLVTEKPGTLRRVAKDGTVSKPLSGVPKVVATGQGGLLDVALDPEFSSNRLVYLYLFRARRGRSLDRGSAWQARRERPRRCRGDLPPGTEGSGRQSFRLASRLCPRRHLVRHARRALPVRSGAGPRQRPRQDRAHQSRWVDPEGQSLRRQGECASRNLVLRTSQSARRRHSSRDRQAVGDRIRSAGRGRAQHSQGRVQLWLAGGELGHAL